jgi:hypothetical protein
MFRNCAMSAACRYPRESVPTYLTLHLLLQYAVICCGRVRQPLFSRAVPPRLPRHSPLPGPSSPIPFPSTRHTHSTVSSISSSTYTVPHVFFLAKQYPSLPVLLRSLFSSFIYILILSQRPVSSDILRYFRRLDQTRLTNG